LGRAARLVTPSGKHRPAGRPRTLTRS
jgi:hypothetical protein